MLSLKVIADSFLDSCKVVTQKKNTIIIIITVHGSIEVYSEISIGMDVVNVGVSNSSCFFILRLCEEREKAWQK